MFIEAICAYIVQELTGFTFPGNLYANLRPDNAPADCLVAYPLSGEKRDFYSPEMRNQTVWFEARAAHYVPAEDMISRIVDLFHGQAQSGYDLPLVTTGKSLHIQTAELVFGPKSGGQDASERRLVQAAILFRYEANG